MFDDLAPNEHPTKGWNRASITFWSRRPYRPRLTAKDRELPAGRGMKVFAQSALAGGLLSVSLVWFLLFVVNMYEPVPGALVGGVIGGAAAALTVLMYAIAATRA